MDRYNRLCQTGQITPYLFEYHQTDEHEWVCRTGDRKYVARGARKKDAKASVCEAIVDAFDAQPAPTKDELPWEEPVWVLVDADAMADTLCRVGTAPWLNAMGFANMVSSVPADQPWPVQRSCQVLPDSADHLLTWWAAQLVLRLTTRTWFVIVSRDAALQNTVNLLRSAGHPAVFVPTGVTSPSHLVRLLHVAKRQLAPRFDVANNVSAQP